MLWFSPLTYFTHIIISCARAVYEEGDKTSPFLSSGVSFGSSNNKLIYKTRSAITVNQQKVAFLFVKGLHSFRPHCSSCSNHRLSPLRDILLEVALFALQEIFNILFCIPILITPCPLALRSFPEQLRMSRQLLW